MPTDDLDTLVQRWLVGFCLSRGVPMRRRGSVVEVDVATESRRVELVLVEPDRTTLEATAGRLVGIDDVWMTVFSRRPIVHVDTDLVVTRLGDERLMVRDLAASGRSTRVEVTPEGDRARAVVRIGDTEAAQGAVAVVGGDAVFDRISTHEDFRRRGLGSEVMTALGDWAVARGARVGLLAASPEGQALYARLGWHDAGHMLTLSGA